MVKLNLLNEALIGGNITLVWLSLILAILGSFNYLRWLKISIYNTGLNRIGDVKVISKEASIVQIISSLILLGYMYL